MSRRLEELVPPVALCERLKSLGVPQESIFYWSCTVREEPNRVTMGRPNLAAAGPGSQFAAFTVAELGKLLPGGIDRGENHYWLQTRTVKSLAVEGWYWNAYYVDENDNYLYDLEGVEEWESLSEATVRARLLIAVLEGKDLRFNT